MIQFTHMKKIIVLIILVTAVAYLVTGDIGDKISGANNSAQAYSTSTPTGYPRIGYYKKQTVLKNNSGPVNFYTYLTINSASSTTITLGLPNILKDGAPYFASSTNFKISAVQVKRQGIFGLRPTGTAMTAQPLNIKKGINTYLVMWTIDSALLPVGSYKMSFSNYRAGNSTTTVDLEQVWSGAVIISENVYRQLHGLEFRLQSFNGKTYEDTETTPHIMFNAGQMYAKFCSNSSGIYGIIRSRLVSTLKGSQPNCNDAAANKVEKDFVLGVSRFGLPATLQGDTLKLNYKTRGFSIDATFVKWTPNASSTGGLYVIPKIYPCDFVGPIEANAVRDCGLGLGVTPGGGYPPIITGLSPTVVQRGSVVTMSGTNFATSNVILFTNISTGTEREAVTVTASASSTSIQFTVPTDYPCPLIATGGSCNPFPLAPGNYSVKVRTPFGVSEEARTLVVQ